MKQVTITIHLGTGKLGNLRKQALLAQAALAGYTYGGQPSIGKLVIAQADEWLAQIEKSIQNTKGTRS